MSLWRSIAKKGLDELSQPEPSEEEKAKAATSRKRKVAAVVVGISFLGLLALTGALTAIFKWLLAAAFVAGLLGGGWYLVRNRWYALKASRSEKRCSRRAEMRAAARVTMARRYGGAARIQGGVRA